MRIQEYVRNGKKYGEIVNNAVFISRRKKSKHLFRALDAWGFDVDALEDLIALGVKLIAVYDTEGRAVYYANPARVNTDGKVMNFGHNPQRFLPRKDFKKAEYAEFLQAVNAKAA
jgi:hypothetical protein